MNVVIWVQYDTIATQDKAKSQTFLRPAFAALSRAEA